MRACEAAFLFVKGECAFDSGSRALLIKGIDQQRLAHFGGGAGKFTQYQDSVSFGLAGDIFLCYQIHPVAQRPDPIYIRQLIERDQFALSIERLM